MKRLLCTTSVLLAVMLVLVFTTTTALATQPRAGASQTVAQGDGAGRDVVLTDLPDMSAGQLAGMRVPPSHQLPHASGPQGQRSIARMQDAANAKPARQQAGGDGPLSASTFSAFLGASQGCNGTGWGPSDMGLAVSAAYVVQVVNECLYVFNKTGGVVAGPKDLCTLFGITPNSGYAGCFDPRLLFDPQANKFVLTASYTDSSNKGYILIASAGNPTLTWHTHKVFQGNNTLADYPTVGQTAYLNNKTNSVITVCYNYFTIGGGFNYAVCDFYPKKAVYGTLGSYPVWSGFYVCGANCVYDDTMQPADSWELSDNPRAQYLLTAVNDGGYANICNVGAAEEGLVVWAMSGNTAGQSSGQFGYTGCGSTSAYSEPGAADDATYCYGCIETLDNRISGKVYYSQGKLLANIDAYNGYSSAVLGWRIAPYLDDNGLGCTGGVNCPAFSALAVEKEYCNACGAGNYFESYFGATAPTPENDWTLFATQSGGSSGKYAASPGQFLITNRVSLLNPLHDNGYYYCYNTANYTQGRWGDYGGAAPDDPGSNPSKVPATWGSGMYVQNSGAWGTCIAGVHPQDAP